MIIALVLPLLAGLLAGWIVNALADTLPITRRLSRPVCSQCGQVYPWPSYLSLRACPNCGHPRGLRAWLVQAALLALSFYTWLKPSRLGYWIGLLLLVYFAVVVVVDLEHRLILHPTSVAGAVLALGIGIWNHSLIPTLLGGVAGLVIMLVLYYLGVLFSKFRARRLRAAGHETDDEEALGTGDVILAGVLGLVLGWPLIWFALLLGILLGGVVGVLLLVGMLIQGRYGKQALMVFMPYGPYFVISTFLILFLPNWIANAVSAVP